MQQYDREFKVIAEIGVNHEGSLDKARELTRMAIEAGADIIKFQSYTPERLIAAHDKTKRERVSQFALKEKDLLNLYELTLELGVSFLSTPVTEDWVEFLNPLCVAFKIASGDISFKPVITRAARTKKNLIISTGAATLADIDRAVQWVVDEVGEKELTSRLILMHCVSAYPTPIEQANLLSIPFLHQRYKVPVGYSNHVVGIHAALGAVALGAPLIEVHFTDQKNDRDFRDHHLALDASDMQQFIYHAREMRKALGSYGKSLQPAEAESVMLIRKGIVAARTLDSGHILREEDLMFARPATEYKAEEIDSLIGKKITCPIIQGHLIPRDKVVCAE